MIAYVKVKDEDKGKKHYLCSNCGTPITNSGAFLLRNGSKDHSFVNPAGIRCDLMTFTHCDNVVADRRLYLEHTWFPGYGWRFLACRICLQHLGWRYDSVKKSVAEIFFGVLTAAVREQVTL